MNMRTACVYDVEKERHLLEECALDQARPSPDRHKRLEGAELSASFRGLCLSDCHTKLSAPDDALRAVLNRCKCCKQAYK